MFELRRYFCYLSYIRWVVVEPWIDSCSFAVLTCTGCCVIWKSYLLPGHRNSSKTRNEKSSLNKWRIPQVSCMFSGVRYVHHFSWYFDWVHIFICIILVPWTDQKCTVTLRTHFLMKGNERNVGTQHVDNRRRPWNGCTVMTTVPRDQLQ